MSTVVQVIVNLLRKDVASQKYIILHDATANPLECHYGKLGWETWMNDLFSEIGIHSKGVHVFLMDYQCSLPETFIWEER